MVNVCPYSVAYYLEICLKSFTEVLMNMNFKLNNSE